MDEEREWGDYLELRRNKGVTTCEMGIGKEEELGGIKKEGGERMGEE